MKPPDGKENFDEVIPTTVWEAWSSGLIIGLLVGGVLGYLVGQWWT
jgi:hypothetical protein